MTIKNTGDGHLALLTKPLDSRPKMLSFGYFVLFIVGGFSFLSKVMNAKAVWEVVFCMVVAIACFIAAYRFLNKAAIAEQLFVGGGELRLIKKSFRSEVRVFAIAGVSQFRYLGKRTPFTRHPLAGDSFDAMGFQTEQELIKQLDGDKRMAFNYKGRVIVFGEDVYSWEFEEVARLVLAAGGDVLMPPPGPAIDEAG